MFKPFIASLSAAALLGGCTTFPAPVDESSTSPLVGSVSAADPRAQEAGLEMLRRGGSATDAAIATMLALTVVEPQSSGIGGGGFLVWGNAQGRVETFDGRETAPAGATPTWFLDADGSVPPFMQSVRSGLSVGVPGNIALAALAHREHGRLSWAELFEPAVRLARNGFVMNERLHNSLAGARDRAGYTKFGQKLFFDAEGEPLPVGTTVRNETLAQTFESLAANGPKAFYHGGFAQDLADTVAADTPRRGAMTSADLAGYRAKEREAVCTGYRGYRVCSMGPPTSGGIAVLQILGQLERFDLTALGLRNPVTWHLFVESQRLAYADRELYLADSDFVPVPVAGLVDPDYLAQRSALISVDSTISDPQPGRPVGAPLALADGDEPRDVGTSHFAAVDDQGTMVSYTSTVEGAFGSGLMFGGFFLNNELTDFSRSPVVEGRSVANRVEGGKRPRSSMSPTLVWDPQGQPFLAIGAAGGSTIPVQTARSIIGAIDFGLEIEDALGVPFIMGMGERVIVERGTWLEEAMDRLEALGHSEVVAREAPVKSGGIKRQNGRWISARDPRLGDTVHVLP